MEIWTYRRVGRPDGESSLLQIMSLHRSRKTVAGTGSPRRYTRAKHCANSQRVGGPGEPIRMADSWSIRRCWFCLTVFCGWSSRWGQGHTVVNSSGAVLTLSREGSSFFKWLSHWKRNSARWCSPSWLQASSSSRRPWAPAMTAHLQSLLGLTAPSSSVSCKDFGSVLVHLCRPAEKRQHQNPNERRHSGAEPVEREHGVGTHEQLMNYSAAQ